MKKVLMVILVLLFLAGAGAGGYFVYAHFIGGSSSSSPSSAETGEYQISKQDFMKDMLKQIKEVSRKKQYKDCIASLDASVNDFLSAVPDTDIATVKSLLQMTDYSEVSIMGLDGYYVAAAPYYQVCYFTDGFYTVNTDEMAAIANAIAGVTDETDEVVETTEVAEEVTESSVQEQSVNYDVDAFYANLLGKNYEPNGIMLFDRQTCEYIYQMLMNTYQYQIPSDAYTDIDSAISVMTELAEENKEAVKSYVEGKVNQLNTTDHFMRYEAGVDNIRLIYELDGKELMVLVVKADGEFFDYTDVLEVLHQRPEWSNCFYNLYTGNGSMSSLGYVDDPLADVTKYDIFGDWIKVIDGTPICLGPDHIEDIEEARMVHDAHLSEYVERYRYTGSLNVGATVYTEANETESTDVATDAEQSLEGETETSTDNSGQDTSDF